MLPPSLVDLWCFALVAQYSSWQSRYLPDVDPNRFVTEPPPVWVERGGGKYEPPAVQQRSWAAAPAASPSAAAASAVGSTAAAPEAPLPGPRPSTLADLLEGKLDLAIAEQHPALDKAPLVEKLVRMSASGGGRLNLTRAGVGLLGRFGVYRNERLVQTET